MAYTTTIENQTFATLDIDTGDDNTLIRNCIFENSTAADGLRIRNVSNVKVENCTFRNLDGFGINLRSLGNGSDGVIIEGCTIHNVAKSGIIVNQREDLNLTHSNCIIRNNIVHDCGSTELEHCIYSQSKDVLIEGNTCYNSPGNGISVRSSGIVRGNTVYNCIKACIRYYSDHQATTNGTVLIENNVCWNENPAVDYSPAISLLDATDYSDSYLAENYIIRFNTVAVTGSTRYGIKAESAVFAGKSVQVYGNVVVHLSEVNQKIDPTYLDLNTLNCTADTLTGLSATPNLRLQAGHGAINYAIGAPSYPLTDIDGNSRQASMLDAGAHQYSIVAPTTPAIYQAAKAKMLDEVSNNPLKAVLLKGYTYNPAHAFLADITAGYRVATTTLTGVTVINGTVDANNPVFTNVSGTLGQIAGAVVVYVELGSEAANRLYAYMDGLTIYLSPTPLTVTTTINENGIFTLGN